jgi:hypothetical protein
VTNPKRAEVPITLDGQVYALRFDMNALAELEEDVGKPIHVFIADFAGQFGISMLRKLLFHGLKAKNPEFVDVRSVGAKMDPEGMGEYGTAVGRALSLAIGGKEPAAEKEDSPKGEDPTPDPS